MQIEIQSTYFIMLFKSTCDKRIKQSQNSKVKILNVPLKVKHVN